MAKRCIKCQEEIKDIYSICKDCGEEFLSDNIFAPVASPLISDPPMDRYRTDSEPLLGIGERPEGELIYKSGQSILEELGSIQIEDLSEEDYPYVGRDLEVILAEMGVLKELDFERYVFSKRETEVLSELFYKLENLERIFPDQEGNADLYLRVGNLFHYSYQEGDVRLFPPDIREEIMDDYLEKAEDYYQLSHETDEDSVYPLKNRAFLLLDAGESERARRYFQRAIDSGDQELKTRLGMIETLIGSEELEKAEEELDLVEEEAEDDPLYWYLRGELAKKEDRWGRAIQFYDEALDRGRFQPAMLSKSELLQERGWDDDAKELCKRILSRDQEDIRALMGMADVSFREEKYEEAIQWLEEVLAVDPQEKSAWVKKADSLRELEKYEEALRGYEKALEIDDDFRPAEKGKKIVKDKIE